MPFIRSALYLYIGKKLIQGALDVYKNDVLKDKQRRIFFTTLIRHIISDEMFCRPNLLEDY